MLESQASLHKRKAILLKASRQRFTKNCSEVFLRDLLKRVAEMRTLTAFIRLA